MVPIKTPTELGAWTAWEGLDSPFCRTSNLDAEMFV